MLLPWSISHPIILLIPPSSKAGIHEGTLPPKTRGCASLPGYNRSMRRGTFVLIVLTLAAAAFCSDQPTTLPLVSCPEGSPGAASCNPSKKELKEASEAFARGLKLQREKLLDQAFDQFETAARLAPKDVEYVTAREDDPAATCIRSLAARQRGNAQRIARSRRWPSFARALHLDPQNEFAQQRLPDAMGEWVPKTSGRAAGGCGRRRNSGCPESGTGRLPLPWRWPRTAHADCFGVRRDRRSSTNPWCLAPVRFDIGQADFYTAMAVACQMTHTFWTPLDGKQILLAAEIGAKSPPV